jgi:hypothetical protein
MQKSFSMAALQMQHAHIILSKHAEVLAYLKPLMIDERLHLEIRLQVSSRLQSKQWYPKPSQNSRAKPGEANTAEPSQVRPTQQIKTKPKQQRNAKPKYQRKLEKSKLKQGQSQKKLMYVYYLNSQASVKLADQWHMRLCIKLVCPPDQSGILQT